LQANTPSLGTSQGFLWKEAPIVKEKKNSNPWGWMFHASLRGNEWETWARKKLNNKEVFIPDGW
jgi:hypothetical protein